MISIECKNCKTTRLVDTNGASAMWYQEKIPYCRKCTYIKRGKIIMSEETKNKISMSHKGKKFTPEHKEKLKQNHRGMLGKKHSKETIEKMSGEHRYNWLGDNVGYYGLHSWVKRWLGKAKKCEFCGKVGVGRSIQWANKSHEYKRDLSDWLSLCCKCHKKYDMAWRIKYADFRFI